MDLHLKGLTSLKDLIIPGEVGGTIYFGKQIPDSEIEEFKEKYPDLTIEIGY